MGKTFLKTSISAVALLALNACGQSASVDGAKSAAGNAATKITDTVMNAALPDLGGGAISTDTPPNYIFMIGDDMGPETLNCYSVGSLQAHTPNLDKLCASGVRFDNFWAQPVCSPTRATLLTGQYGFMNGVGAPLGETPGIDWKVPGGPVDDNPANAAMGAPAGGMGGMGGGMGGPGAQGSVAVKSERILTDGAPAPEAPAENSVEGLKTGIYSFIEALSSDEEKNYQTAAVGKWHLAGSGNGGLAHPNIVGFDHFTGPMRGGGVAYYDAWSKSTNGGDPFGVTGYVTTDTIDDGIAWIDTVEGESPFFLWVAFNAPHTPFHMPPAELLTSDLKNLSQDETTPQQQYLAMIEAMDSEIGRLVASLEPETLANTYISFMGDNGTPGQSGPTVPYGRTKSKGSLYQGGVNVPFFVAGPGIAKGSVTPALSNSVDIYKTVLDVSGVNDPKASAAVHSVSLKPVLLDNPKAKVRDFAFADVFGVSGPTRKNLRTIRNERYKIIENVLDNTVEFYDLKDDPYESANLLKSDLSSDAQSNLESLQKNLAELVSAQ